MALCLIPLLLGAIGANMGSSDSHGPILHLVLEWTSVMFALGVGIISIAQYPVTRQPFAIVFGTAFLCSGMMDAFHALAAGGLISGSVDAQDFIPFTWALSRLFNATIVSTGTLIFLLKPNLLSSENSRVVWAVVGVVFAIALGSILYCTQSTSLPTTQFPGSLISRPWDVGPLVIYLLSGLYLARKLRQRKRSPFTCSLVLSLFTGVGIELYMSLGSEKLFDHYFNGAHSLKIVAYVVPLLGLLVEYVQTYWQQDELRRKIADATRFSRAVVVSATDAIIATDEHGTIAGVNPAVERYFGYASLELEGTSIDALLEKLDLIEILEKRKQGVVGEPGQTRRCTFKNISATRADGVEIPMNVSVCATQGDEARSETSKTLVFTFSDLTEINAQKAQRESADHMLRFLVDGLGEAVIFADSGSNIVGWNMGATTMFGFDALQASKIKFCEVIPGVMESVIGIEKADGGFGSMQKRVDGIHRSGRTFPISVSISTWLVNGTNMVGALVIDETERQKSEERLRVGKEDAERASKSKSQFLANMSHELRTPLNGILGMAQLLEKTGLDEEQLFYAKVLGSSTKSLTIIINDILDSSKIEAGELALEAIPFAPRELVEQVVDLVKLGSSKSHIRYWVKVVPATVTFAIGDPYRIRQILINLLSNAEKFTESGSIGVTLRSAIDGDDRLRLFFTVEDTGVGIAAEARERMFNAFEQADVSVTRSYGGTGLGLTICRQLTTLMGGRIGYQPGEVSGSCFRFNIVCDATNARVARESPPGFAPNFSGRILVAEDNAVNQMVIGAMLKKMGHEFEIVANGKLACEMVKTGRFDLVLMDCQMPEMGGLEATEFIRKQSWGTQIPIIALTAQALSEDRQRCLDAGMSDYLSKPIDLQKLSTALEQSGG